MIRLIIRTDNAGMAANVGGDVETSFRTFDVNLPELEAFLREPIDGKWSYTQRVLVGAELLRKEGNNGS